MTNLIAEFLPIFVIIALGILLGKSAFLTAPMVEGLKKIAASVALPVLLFSAFSNVAVNGKLMLLAIFIFVLCGALGLAGWAFSGLFRLSKPSTIFLFQGFEAGMLGYALFTSLFGFESLSHFAAADLGQVVYVFTVLMAQMLKSNEESNLTPGLLFKRMLFSPVIIAIILGLLVSLFFGSTGTFPWNEGGLLYPLFTAFSALLTPLVCLVIGYSLKDFSLKGSGKALLALGTRFISAVILGTLLSFVVLPLLGYTRLQSVAVLFLFILPPPFVIPIFTKDKRDAAYIGTVLSLHTVLSILAAVILVFLFRTV